MWGQRSQPGTMDRASRRLRGRWPDEPVTPTQKCAMHRFSDPHCPIFFLPDFSMLCAIEQLRYSRNLINEGPKYSHCATPICRTFQGFAQWSNYVCNDCTMASAG